MNLVFALLLEVTGSFVNIYPVENEHSQAELYVEFMNNETNTEYDNKEYVLNYKDMTMSFRFYMNSGIAGMDKITVLPPEGMSCDPASCEVELMEGYSGKIFLIPWLGM